MKTRVQSWQPEQPRWPEQPRRTQQSQQPRRAEGSRLTRAAIGGTRCHVDLLTARFDHRHRNAPHAHDEFSFGICLGGSSRIDYRGGVVDAGPGAIVVIDPGEAHTGFAHAGRSYACLDLYPVPDLLAEGSAPACVIFLDEPLTAGVLASLALILAGSFLATSAAAPPRPSRPVPWSTRQTSRADGRVEFP